MLYASLGLFIIGIIVLVVGYRKNDRNMLVVAAIILFTSAALEGFVQGLEEGLMEAQREHSSIQYPELAREALNNSRI